jgi:hypothetical protein
VYLDDGMMQAMGLGGEMLPMERDGFWEEFVEMSINNVHDDPVGWAQMDFVEVTPLSFWGDTPVINGHVPWWQIGFADVQWSVHSVSRKKEGRRRRRRRRRI